MKQESEIIEFNAIAFWEVVLSFFVMLAFVYGITEFAVVPLTKGNMAMRTKFIIFMMTMISISYIVYQHWRTKRLSINLKKNSYEFNENNENIQDLKIHIFLFKKVTGRILRVNNKLFLLLHIYKNPFATIDKEQKNTYKKRIEIINDFAEKSEINRTKFIDIIPIGFNISCYLLFIIAFALFTFLFTAIFTDNTQWFNYFKN